MAKFELNIYGEDEAIVKQYATNVCPWSLYIQAVEVSDVLDSKTTKEQVEDINNIIKSLFNGLTDAELMAADCGDVRNTFQQIIMCGQKIKGKNA